MHQSIHRVSTHDTGDEALTPYTITYLIELMSTVRVFGSEQITESLHPNYPKQTPRSSTTPHQRASSTTIGRHLQTYCITSNLHSFLYNISKIIRILHQNHDNQTQQAKIYATYFNTYLTLRQENSHIVSHITHKNSHLGMFMLDSIQKMYHTIETLSDVTDTSNPSSPIRTFNMAGAEIITFSATKPTPMLHPHMTPENNAKRPADHTTPSTEKKNKVEHYKPVNAHRLWYGYHTMEARAMEHKVEARDYTTINVETLAKDLGISPQEAAEFKNSRHAFPHVPQVAYPTERCDGKNGQYLHLTQLPKDTITNSFGFEHNSYQLTLWCDNGFSLSRRNVEHQIIERIQAMGMQLGEEVIPNLVVFAPDDRWLGFAKIYLSNPQDCLDLLSGRRPFIIHTDASSPVILKIEKAFELPTKAERLAVHVDAPGTMDRLTQEQVMSNSIYESYRLQLEYEIMRVSKLPTNTFVHVYLASFESTANILKHGLKLQGNVSLVAAPKKDKTTRAQEQEQAQMDYALTLTVSQIARQDTQASFTTAFTRLVAKSSIKALYFVGMKKNETVMHSRKVHFVCANAVIYNRYLHKKNVPCGKGFIDFNAHRRSIEGSEKPSKEILEKLGVGDFNKALANTIETFTVSHISDNGPTSTSTPKAPPHGWEEEIKRLEQKLDTQEERLEKKLSTTITKRASIHMDKLYAKYAEDLATQMSTLINERTAYFIKHNPTFEEASTSEDDALTIMEVGK